MTDPGLQRSASAEPESVRTGRRRFFFQSVLLVFLVGAGATMVLPPAWFGMGAISPSLLQVRLSLSDPDIAVLDVRTGIEFERGHIAGARLIPLHVLPFRLGGVSNLREREVVLICMSGHRSRLAGLILRLAGFDRITNLEGGMAAWRAQGLRVVS
ncbi:MAG: rhodanese-like domain-containing protein [Leptospirillia bacterium]